MDPRARQRPGHPVRGNYTGFLEQKESRFEAEQKTDDRRQRTLKRELEWVRMAPKARQAKGKARLAAYDKLLEEAKAAAGRSADLEILIPADERLGDLVIEAENVSKSFGDTLLIDDLSFSLPPAGIVGIIGANGAGKTTLFRMIIAAAERRTGDETVADSGVLQIGPTVRLGYVDQDRTLDASKSVYDEIIGGVDDLVVGGREVNGAGLRRLVQLQGIRSTKERWRPVGR